MKKLFCILLTLMLVLTIGNVAFAAEDATTDGGAVLERNVDTATYKTEMTEVKKQEQEISPGTVEIDEMEIPLAPALPSTGGIPAESFYVVGALFVVAAIFIALKRDKAGQKA